MKILTSKNKINVYLIASLMVFIIFNFITPVYKYSLAVELLVILLLVLFIIYLLSFKGKILTYLHLELNELVVKEGMSPFKVIEVIGFSLAFFVIPFLLFLNPYKVYHSLIALATLFVFILVYRFGMERINDFFNLRKLYNLFYWIFLMFLIVTFVIQNFIIKSGNFEFSGWDKNYSALIVFFFFLYCFKLRKKLGILFCLVFILATPSRAYLMAIMVFFICYLLRRQIYFIYSYFFKKKTFLLVGFCTIVTLLFSYYWVEEVAKDSVGENYTSLNDSSNKTRFVSNIRGLEVLVESPEMLVFGYEDSLKEKLGIASVNYWEHQRYYGVRIVQPHNSILNTILKVGVVISLFYFYCFFKLVDRLILVNKENLTYFIAILSYAMIMHSLFVGGWALFLLFILTVSNSNGKKGPRAT